MNNVRMQTPGNDELYQLGYTDGEGDRQMIESMIYYSDAEEI
jgi:hypothetical protein